MGTLERALVRPMDSFHIDIVFNIGYVQLIPKRAIPQKFFSALHRRSKLANRRILAQK